MRKEKCLARAWRNDSDRRVHLHMNSGDDYCHRWCASGCSAWVAVELVCYSGDLDTWIKDEHFVGLMASKVDVIDAGNRFGILANTSCSPWQARAQHSDALCAASWCDNVVHRINSHRFVGNVVTMFECISVGENLDGLFNIFSRVFMILNEFVWEIWSKSSDVV